MHAQIDHILPAKNGVYLIHSLSPINLNGLQAPQSPCEDWIEPYAGKVMYQPGIGQAVHDENIFSKIQSTYDWKFKDDSTEDYEQLVEGLKSCAELTSVTQSVHSHYIFTNIKELLEKRKRLRFDFVEHIA
ncbi:hypothetical protein KIN20_009172 [Parelaphostrongylus tenuis]|uniref:Uncharacterized protein n=1 Tax=Parelaphostrongylus tenuis TaxID=148309 RepID=A0AAD5QKH3_PARTN|nr:hypothetical protein KIN20_009172 [Parelaphostrongylus tenuis]